MAVVTMALLMFLDHGWHAACRCWKYFLCDQVTERIVALQDVAAHLAMERVSAKQVPLAVASSSWCLGSGARQVLAMAIGSENLQMDAEADSCHKGLI